MKKFQVGDEVICSENGLGKVVKIETATYSVIVEFIIGQYKSIDSYTETGRMYNDPEDDEGEHIRHLTKLERALK